MKTKMQKMKFKNNVKSIVLLLLITSLLLTIFPYKGKALQTSNDSKDYEQSNITNEKFSSGGFISDDTNSVNSKYNYFFEVEYKKGSTQNSR